jgi:hypothetical protein
MAGVALSDPGRAGERARVLSPRPERQIAGGGVRLPPSVPGERREMAGVPREQAQVVIHSERPRETLDEPGLKRGVAALSAQVTSDRAGKS